MALRSRVTSFEIAERAGVSQPTVSRALRGMPGVHPETRRRVLEVAKELCYTADFNASRLRTGRTQTIAHVMLCRTDEDRARINPFNQALLGAVAAAAAENGRKLGSAVMRTAGEPAKLRLTPDQRSLQADGEDLSYVLVEALDRDGNPCPLAMNDVAFKLEGPVTIAGVANGDHHFPAEFDADHVTLLYGKAVLILRAVEGQRGSIRATATSVGLRPAAVSLRSRHGSNS